MELCGPNRGMFDDTCKVDTTCKDTNLAQKRTGYKLWVFICAKYNVLAIQNGINLVCCPPVAWDGVSTRVVESSVVRCCNAEHVLTSGLVNGHFWWCFLQANKACRPLGCSLFCFLCTSDCLLVTCRWIFTVQCTYLGKKSIYWRGGIDFFSQAISEFFLFFYIFLLLCTCVSKFPFPVYKCLADEVTGVFFPVLPLQCSEHKQNVIIHWVSAEYRRNNESVPKA